MGGTAQALRLGPFTGGLNNASDPTAVADSELVECLNMELDIDGSLICRPPIVETTNNSGTTTERLVVIGRAVLSGGTYIFASNVDGTFAFNGSTWSTVKLGLQARCAVQFQDLVFIPAINGSTENGGYWNGTTWTTDTNMPDGEVAVFHKSRMFIVPGVSQTGAAAHQLRYTDPISVSAPTPLVWTGTNNISVSQGDGEKLIDIVVYNDNLMLFKQDSSYVLAYDIQPTDAILRKINNDIGATTRHCVVSYENSIFTFHEGNVYEIVNYDFQRINVKVPFVFDGAVPASTRAEEVFISVFGDRLVVRYYNRIYVFGLKTRTWSRWESASSDLHNFGPLVEYPSNPTQSVNRVYYAGSSITNNEKIYKIADGYDASTIESTLVPTNFDITCKIQTKNYDLADSHHFKRLMWWGVDIVSNRTINGKATPVIADFQVTWDDVDADTWDSHLTTTWDQPNAFTMVTVETSVADQLNVGRKFVKFLKALRWRQINYTVTLLCNGSTTQGPARVFSITTIVGTKQTVVKQVS